MKNLVKLIGILLVVLLVASFMQPDSYQIRRSVVIQSPTTEVFKQISDLKLWPNWSPWLSENQEMQINFSEETTEVGGFAEWNGTLEEHGRHVIFDVETNRSMKVEFEFSQPYPHKAKSQFLLEDLTDDQTELTWIYYGKNPTIEDKLYFLIFSMKEKIELNYDTALNKIKLLAESKEGSDLEENN